jgi:hypothetical protein
MTAYTFLWSEKTWKARAKEVLEGKNRYIDYVAGEAKRPMTNFSDGDEIFVVTVIQGQLFLGGRLVVDSLPVSRERAQDLLGRSDLLDKELFVMAKISNLDKFRSGKPVASEAAQNLDLITVEGVRKKPDLDKKNMIDRQAFRIPYKLSPESASILRELLDLPAEAALITPSNGPNDGTTHPSNPAAPGDINEDTNRLATQRSAGLNVDHRFDTKINEEVTSALQNDLSLESSLIAVDYVGRPGVDIEAVVKRRLGQGSFRRLLVAQHGLACFVSGLSNNSLLIASHIVPWSESSPDQKTDPENGLLLSVSWDALFDKGFITFDAEGQLLCSSILDHETVKCLGISLEVRLNPTLMTERRRTNLRWHRDHVFNGLI